MRNLLRCLSLLLLVVVCSATTAVAGDLDVHFDYSCIYGPAACNFAPFDQQFGDPATGWATFTNTPWTLNFETGKPESWNGDNYGYSAIFGVGGTVQMAGPNNLTFLGAVMSGETTANFLNGYSHIDLFFDGYWSNNDYAYGEIQMRDDPDFGPQVSLDVTTVPEPTSLALLGGGIAGAWGVGRRRSRL